MSKSEGSAKFLKPPKFIEETVMVTLKEKNQQAQLWYKIGAAWGYVLEKMMEATVGFVAVSIVICTAIAVKTLVNHEHFALTATVNGHNVMNVTIQPSDHSKP